MDQQHYDPEPRNSFRSNGQLGLEPLNGEHSPLGQQLNSIKIDTSRIGWPFGGQEHMGQNGRQMDPRQLDQLNQEPFEQPLTPGASNPKPCASHQTYVYNFNVPHHVKKSGSQTPLFSLQRPEPLDQRMEFVRKAKKFNSYEGSTEFFH